MLNEGDIDFRIPGLPHSVVKQADNYRVRELIEKIEIHPRIKPTEASSNIHWVLLSIPNYVIEKGRPHGHRYGKTLQERDIIKPIIWKRDASRGVFEGIHDRFLNDPDFRASQLEHDRTEEVCIKMDGLADKDFTHHMTQAEFFDTNRIGGFLSTSLETLDHWEIVLTSKMCWRATTVTNAILEVSAMASIIEFFLQLVAMEWFLVEFIIIQRKSKWGHSQSDMIERRNLLFAVFG